MDKLLTFDDVLILPNFNRNASLKSRNDVVLDGLPIVSANMESVTGEDMALGMIKNGAFACIPRFYKEGARMILEYCSKQPNFQTNVVQSIGINDRWALELAREFKLKTVCLDVAHCAQLWIANKLSAMMMEFPEFNWWIGNFGDPGSVLEFLQSLNSSHKEKITHIKLGIGSGSVCQTRTVTGVGIPQFHLLQATRDLFDVYGIKKNLISDGGHKTTADITKALVYADIVMLGGMLAKTNASANQDMFYGSASIMQNSKIPTYKTHEGIHSTKRKDLKDLSVAIQEIEGAIRSACTYVGASNLREFKVLARFAEISDNAKHEGTPHFEW